MPDNSTTNSEDLLRIKQDEKLVLKSSSNERSISNTVYYGGNSIGIPFMWELKPGTPKQSTQCHSASNSHNTTLFSDIHPLTPPPSYYNNNSETSAANQMKKRSNSNLLNTLFPKLSSISTHKKSHSFSSEISSTSSNSVGLVSMSPLISKSRRSWFSSSMVSRSSSVDYRVEDDDMVAEAGSSPTSVLCFRVVGNKKWKIQKSISQVMKPF